MLSRKIAVTPEESKKIQQIAATADDLPGVVVIHKLPDFSLLYMSKLGLQLLDVEWNEIDGISNADYHKRFFNEEITRFLSSFTLRFIAFLSALCG